MILFLITLIVFPVSASQTPMKDNSASCDCYVTTSSDYFQYHRFFDFQSLTSTKGLYAEEPANVSNSQSGGQEDGQQGFLNSTSFANDWKINNWGRDAGPSRPVTLQNSKQNVWIQKNSDTTGTYLALRTHRNTNFSSCAEIESTEKNLFHASIRVYARVRGDAGAVAGLFTYYNNSQESDIEMLTKDSTDIIHYTNQPNTDANGHTIAAAGTQSTLPNDRAWTNWTTHRLDWTPTVSRWFVNDIFVANKTYGVPTVPSYFVLNMWSNGGNWTGNMTVGSAAYLEVQWIDMFFNTSGPVTGPTENKRDQSTGCSTVCAADGIKQVGHPEVLHSSGITSSTYGLSMALLLFLATVTTLFLI